MNKTKNNTASFEQAMLWLLRLQENPSQEQLNQWQQWLQSDTDNSRAFNECLALDSQFAKLPPETVNNFLRLLPEKNAQPQRMQWSKYLTLAASVAVISISISFYTPSNTQAYTTAVGETKSVTLADGSNIMLDSDTDLSVYYDDQQRRIELHQGQAVFNVAKQTNRPFLVSVNEITVTVLGTHFNVNRLKNDAVIAVDHGKVNVYDPTFGNILLEDKQGYYSYDDRKVELTNIHFAMWQQGQIHFSHTPLNLAIEQLNRYQTNQLQLGQQQLAQLTISGTFQLNDVSHTAQLLPKILPIEVISKNNHWLLLPRKELATQ
ncbi:hypothetical protein CWB85_00020 [Pseudoalteromonas sp. S1727]|uniref:FecR family protein n=1 Tax=Pseudoalteromonas sp. S1727 TaxID=2066514 RepID=UPI0011080174|nr:FecR domain-containing protein [Pseudoalteromonas sp. S1727]TMN74786.1 hypothetical protein CWB85_00020 [Pseudoalteromonas sp. S1727]